MPSRISRTAKNWHSKKMLPLRKSLVNALVVARKRRALRKIMPSETAERALKIFKSVSKFGKKFLTTFPAIRVRGRNRKAFLIKVSESLHESPVSVSFNVLDTSKGFKSFNILKLGEARLSFEKEAVVIEAIQGIKSIPTVLNAQAIFDQFKSISGKPWANFILENIESHARRIGLKQVKIVRPEESILASQLFASPKSEDRENFERLRKFYYALAKNCGYSVEGSFFVKNL